MSFVLEKSDRKLAVLVDPDRYTCGSALHTQLRSATPDLLLLGGSTLLQDNLETCIADLRSQYSGPIYLFPGSQFQLSPKADGILLISLLSGRNSDLIIGKHVEAAPLIKQYGLNTLGCAYLLVDGGRLSSVQYISQTLPIPRDKPEIALATALAAEQLGFATIYLEAGSGAKLGVPLDMVRKISAAVSIPIIVGGGIRSLEMMEKYFHSGANMLVIGTAIEEDPSALTEMLITARASAKMSLR